MKVEITETRLRDAGYNLVAGDALTVPDEVGTTWCRHGWAKDTDGAVPTGRRIVRGATIEPENVSATTDAKEV
jgi:hypothetical protein